MLTPFLHDLTLNAPGYLTESYMYVLLGSCSNAYVRDNFSIGKQ